MWVLYLENSIDVDKQWDNLIIHTFNVLCFKVSLYIISCIIPPSTQYLASVRRTETESHLVSSFWTSKMDSDFRFKGPPPQVPTEPMDFLSRDYCNSKAVQIFQPDVQDRALVLQNHSMRTFTDDVKPPVRIIKLLKTNFSVLLYMMLCL